MQHILNNKDHKKKSFKYKNIISLFLAVIFIIGAMPLDVVYGDTYTISEIRLFKTFEGLTETYTVSIFGTGLKSASIMYMRDGGSLYEPFTTEISGGTDFLRQFKVDPGTKISEIRAGTISFLVNETNMPRVTSVTPAQVDLKSTSPSPKATINGEKFNNFGSHPTNGETTIRIGNDDLTGIFTTLPISNSVTLEEPTLRSLGHGIKNIVINNEKNVNDVKITTTYNHNKAFRIYESINIDQKNITIFPNRGKIGTNVNITIKDDDEDYSVFFLSNETDKFMYENMGEDPYYPVVTSDDDGRISVKVPKGLSPGTYKVVITNNLDSFVKNPGQDLTNLVIKQQTIGEFVVVDAEVGPTIIKTSPSEGTNAGAYLTIYGRRFEELDITGLVGVNDTVDTTDKLEVTTSGTDGLTRLRINYYDDNTDPSIAYNGKQVKHLTRDFLVIIGRDALFEEDYKGNHVFRHGDSNEDQLYVKTKTIEEIGLKDVIMEITTTITVNSGETFVFTEAAELANGYRFLASHQDPQIDKVTPDKIQVESVAIPKTTNDTILSIQGNGFNVFRYADGVDMKTNYPKVIIGGAGESTADIIIERSPDGKVYYSTKDATESTGYKKEERTGVIFEVLDKNGNIVTGIGGNETGTSLVLTIPEGLGVSPSNINTAISVSVANPKRDSAERGLYSIKHDAITFVTVTSSPIIEKVDPYIVTVDGGEDVVIEGRNFQDGIKVFIDGKEVTNVVRDIDKITTRGTLKFKAPKGREGANIIQIMNPDGGSDTHQFIYVQTMRIDPRITTIAPNKGTEDTLVIIKGDNFLKPDQTVTNIDGLGLYKLIGTRVYLGNEDVNKYTTDPSGLEKYESPDINLREKLFKIEPDPRTNLKRLMLSAYYKSAVISAGEEHYTISVDYEGNPVILGKNESYTIKLIGEDIKAINSSGEILDNVVIDKDTSAITIDGQPLDIIFDYSLFSVNTNEVGTKSLRVADYYDSLILQQGASYYTIEVNDAGRVTLSDGKNNVYEIKLDGRDIVAIRGSNSDVVTVNNDSIVIDGEIFEFKTPYAQDPSTGIITGHRAKVKNRNEIWVTIPKKDIPGFYDVTVRNPDTKSFTVKNGFEYLIPQSKPMINYISPSQGSVEGGYEVVIYGEGFQNTTEVYIAGVKVPDKDVKIDTVNYTSITVTVPKYPGDINTDFITDKKFVPVTVLNEDGGHHSKYDLFAYVIASSRPRIDRINPVKGTAAGGDVVEIWGYDFRYYEPYKGKIPTSSDDDFDDLDKDGKWTNYKTEKDAPQRPLDHPIFTEYSDSPVLPSVYFGREKAKIVEFREGYMKVIVPTSTAIGAVDVYIMNNDSGRSNKVRFTYEGSNPTIKSILPNVGKKQGGEKVDVIGSSFKLNTIDLIDKDKVQTRANTYLVKFGEISNSQIPREAENSGLINQGMATVNLAGDLKVEHKVVDGAYRITISLTEDKVTYTEEYTYDSGAKYIDVKGLKDKDNKDNSYTGNELIKVEVKDGRLLVTRGYSPQVRETFKDQLEVITPTYYTVGNINVVVENPDGVSNKAVYQYKNPDSRPQITNITRDGQQPQLGDNGAIKILTVNMKGGSTIVIEGRDFRDVDHIQIGNILKIDAKDILVNEPNRLVFKMPAVNESALAFLHKVVVVNDDGGTASSDAASPPIYIQFIKGESSPQIESITPPRGPASGGNSVIIKGKDFRETMEGYTGSKLKVYFDGQPVPDKDVNVIDHKTISVVVPSGTPGSVEVKVENPDGEMSNAVNYTYASNPRITAVVDPLDPTEKSRISVISILGGQEIKLKGSGFMAGAKVYFNPKITPADESTGNNKNLIYIEGIPYILESGTEGTDYNFINSETATIKTPPGKTEDFGVIIVNPDGGASPIYTNLTYGLPEITAPTGVVAELVYDRFIRVHWNPVSGATEYEIFVVIDDKNTELIGSTELTSFAYNDLEPRTRYKFIVKAVGDFGSSKPSMESNTVRTGSEVGPPDEDGGLVENTTMSKTGNTANVVIGTKDRNRGTIVIDLTRGALAGSKELVVSIPASVVVDNDSRNIQVIGKDFTLQLQTAVFNVANVRENRNKADAGVRFVISEDSGNTQVLSGNQLSTVYNLKASIYVGQTTSPMDYLASAMSFTLDYDEQKASLRKLTELDFNYFDPVKNTWEPLATSSKNWIGSASSGVIRLGKYAIIGSRR
ncbi:IPT/TIG domain-containing protein [Alkaliphilus sp. B6464]|uniref:IPT/TIG domain-containing protein n=1 Tax=Alkaliphilus sp. B6464 TaxID=2731219 RepID=UPI001BAE0827|nr:IPT/TIG domain-containing protein [Alkaliphilus sp. B6464]QUH19146.1 IPT/TIG domain-containing protein [Alkaliphilus sp. B6464]